MLHLIFKSPSDKAVLERVGPGDAVVFIGNSVVLALRQGLLAQWLVENIDSRPMYVLSDDLGMRGIASDTLVEGIDVIDYSGLVELTLEHKVIQSWY
ncbi:MAG: sulfurtransferase complex subunit TusB [Gammaproteobacteria bacterium]